MEADEIAKEDTPEDFTANRKDPDTVGELVNR